MGYLIAALLVLLVVGGLVTFLVLNATKRSNAGAVGEGAPPGIGGDETPLGDTREHAGEQTAGGATARDPEAGGEARDPDAAAHLARPGEAEGRERITTPGVRPEGESRRVDPEPAEEQAADEEPTRAAERAAPDEPRDRDEPQHGDADEDEPAPPASERLADRGF